MTEDDRVAVSSPLPLGRPAMPFRAFLRIVALANLAFALPTLAVVLGQRLMALPAVVVIFPMLLVTIPLMAGLAWLLARGSRWVGTLPSLKAAGAVAGQFYGPLLGGLWGARESGGPGGLTTAAVFLVLGTLAGWAIGGWLANRAGISE